MKIKMSDSGRVYVGSPEAIVDKLRLAAVFAPTPDVDAYMRSVRKRQGRSTVIQGGTVEERCDAFVRDMIRMDRAIELEA